MLTPDGTALIRDTENWPKSRQCPKCESSLRYLPMSSRHTPKRWIGSASRPLGRGMPNADARWNRTYTGYRELAEVAPMPEVREQLALFADEFEAHAEALDRIGIAATREGDAKC